MNGMTSDEEAITAAASRLFDVNRWSDYPELNNCLAALVQEIEASEGRQRRRGGKDARRFKDALRSLVLDLYVAWKTDPELEVAISLANRSYSKSSRYRALFIRYASFIAAFEGLEARGYLTRTKKGFYDAKTGIGRVTRIKADPKLVELLTVEAHLTVPAISQRNDGVETILLKSEKCEKVGAANLIEYEDTAETRSMRANLARINEHLQRHWVDLRITDADFNRLQQRMRQRLYVNDKQSLYIDFGHRSLVRIFNNADWEQGGRFYRGWWQSIPKAYRRYITIDEKTTVEVDYSGLHVHMLYAKLGESLEGDAYDLGDSNIDRGLIKKIFNALINAKGRINEPPDFKEKSGGLSFKELQSKIIERNFPIRQFFATGFGLRLQKLDSLLAEAVMLRFLAMGYVCLPVHDSFIVHYALEDELKDIMSEEYENMFGQPITVKKTRGVQHTLRSAALNANPPVNDTATFLKPNQGPYAAYEQRHIEWWSSRDN